MTNEEMKKKLKHKLKMLAFDEAMAQSAANIAAVGVKPLDGVAPDSWEGMMQMLSKVMKSGEPGEKAAAMLAAAAWVWGHKEKCLYERICEIIDAVVEEDAERQSPVANDEATAAKK